MSSELVTIAEAAQRLGVSIPRLRRLLARPEWSACKQEQVRETRTGTRTATVVPVSVLESLSSALQSPPEPERERIEPEREQKRNENGNDSALLEQIRARLADKAEENAFLRSELTAAREERNKSEGEWRLILAAQEQTEQDLRRQISGLQQQLALPEQFGQVGTETEPAPAVETPHQASNLPRTADLEENAGNSAPKRKSFITKVLDMLLFRA